MSLTTHTCQYEKKEKSTKERERERERMNGIEEIEE